MKKNLLAITLCFLTLHLFGQREETLFSKAKYVGAFGGPIIEIIDVNNNITTSIGGGGGIIIDGFFIGGYGMGAVDLNELSFEDNQPFRLDMAHGGFWLGYSFKQHKLLHLFGSAKIGWGGIDVDFDAGPNTLDHIFVVTPEVGVELNIFRWFKLAGTVGYRNVTGVSNVQGKTNSDFTGTVGTLTFRFGGFGRWGGDRDDW